jgi:L-lactate dehydrogenase complex protein LldG
MRLPAFTGWGYSKDFPRPASRPFRARWKGIQQEVVNKATGTMPQTAHPVQPLVAQPLIGQFTDEITNLGGNVVRVPESELPAQIIQYLRKRKIKSIYVDDAGAKHVSPLREAGITLIREADPKVHCGPSASPRAGITGALAGIADTGTLVIVGGKGRPLTVSLLPEIHVAILRAKDIYANLPQVLNLPEVRKAPAVVLISGPSRTADIEMTLTIGVHGPKELHVFLVE